MRPMKIRYKIGKALTVLARKHAPGAEPKVDILARPVTVEYPERVVAISADRGRRLQQRGKDKALVLLGIR
jgi:hypothetical protein